MPATTPTRRILITGASKGIGRAVADRLAGSDVDAVGSERESALLQNIPMRRVGRPAEIAQAICFLLDEDAGYLTGQTIGVDGGGSLAG